MGHLHGSRATLVRLASRASVVYRGCWAVADSTVNSFTTGTCHLYGFCSGVNCVSFMSYACLEGVPAKTYGDMFFLSLPFL